MIVAIGWFSGRESLRHSERRLINTRGLAIAPLVHEGRAEVGVRIGDLEPIILFVWSKLDHPVGQTLILAPRGFGLLNVSSLIGDRSDPEDVLCVVEEFPRIVRIAAHGFARARQRLLVTLERTAHIAAGLCDLTHQRQDARALGESL